jgi:DNA-binding transcriptional MerR regulator
MEQLTTGVLRRSSDAVVIIGLAEGTVVDVNEAFFTMTGHARHEFVGRPGSDLLVGLGEDADPTAVEVLGRPGSVADIPVGFWTHSGELRVGDLSALVLEVEGRRVALCTIRGVRDATPGQRRSVACKKLERILEASDPRSDPEPRALQAFGSCLRWEFGALWRGAPPPQHLRCTAVWHSPQSDLGPLEEASRFAAFPSTGTEVLRRVRLQGEPIWVPDALADAELSRAQIGIGEPMRGWLGFPALGTDGVVGVVEFVSRETRQPDPELLEMMETFGRLFGRLLEDVEAPGFRRVGQAEVGPGPAVQDPSPGTTPAALRDLAGAVTAASEALERHPTPPDIRSTALLGELTAGIGKLNRLLQSAIQQSPEGPPITEGSPTPPARTTAEPPPALPSGMTLKAVSRRTGIPAATLRTWEHRYGFLRPQRSPTGYRLYGEAEIARIEQVKYLVGQGIRIGAAMKAVIKEAGVDEPAEEGRQPAGPRRPDEDSKHAEVYRLGARSSPRGKGSSRGLGSGG